MNINLASFMLYLKISSPQTFGQKTVKIFLDIRSYDCLREHLSSELVLRSCLRAAVLRLGDTRVVDCDEKQARELLVIARNHCPGAVRKIKEAMLMAGLS